MNRHALNNAVLTLAPSQWEAKALAPASLADLMRSPRIVVWDGASDATIYRDAKVNHAFRAWHDAGHIELAAPFTLEGERAVMRWQQGQVLERWPNAPRWLLDLIRVEVEDQSEYFETHGTFPINQEGFHNAI